jgi:hypothetical protein
MPVLADDTSGAIGQDFVRTMVTEFAQAGRYVLQQNAERYWLLRFEGDELRFTHRAAAEAWAAQLAGRGIATQLTRHDENAPPDLQIARQVA